MAYRKTEKVLAGIEQRKAAILAAAIHIIGKHGMEALTTDNIATRAQVSVGLLYKYFPDMTEMRAAVIAQLLARDLETIRDAGSLEKGIRAWAKNLAANYRLMSAICALPGYRVTMRAELTKMIRATGAENAPILSAVVYGAVLEAASTLRPRDEQTLVACVLRAVGVRVRVAA